MEASAPEPMLSHSRTSGEPNLILDMQGKLVGSFSFQKVPLSRVSWAMQSAGAVFTGPS